MKYISTGNLALACALTALGHHERNQEPVTTVTEKLNGHAVTTQTFWLEATAVDGIEGEDNVRAWSECLSPEWLKLNSTHPLRPMRVAMKSFMDRQSAIKAKLLRFTTTADESIAISDTALAAALYAFGITEFLPTKHGDTYHFHFFDSVESREIVQRWSLEWIMANEEHPLSYVFAMLKMREVWLSWMSQARRQIKTTRGDVSMTLPADIAPDEQKKWLHLYERVCAGEA